MKRLIRTETGQLVRETAGSTKIGSLRTFSTPAQMPKPLCTTNSRRNPVKSSCRWFDRQSWNSPLGLRCAARPFHGRITGAVQRIVIMIGTDAQRISQPAGGKGRKILSEHKYRSLLFERRERQHLGIFQLAARRDASDHRLDAYIVRLETGEIDRRAQRPARIRSTQSSRRRFRNRGSLPAATSPPPRGPIRRVPAATQNCRASPTPSRNAPIHRAATGTRPPCAGS